MTQEATTPGLVCKQSGAPASRHFAMNDIIWRSLLRADIPSSKEPHGLLRTDGKRPDGATLVPCSDILVLKIILVLVFIQFWGNNFYFSFSFSFEIILVSISVLVLVLK